MASRDLHGMVIVVTGASRGMGLAFCESLIAAGAHVALLARPSKNLDEAAERLGARAFAAGCDVSKPDDVRNAFKAVGAHFGRIDILINNAAISSLIRLETATDEEIEREVAVNFTGAVYCTREALPYLREAKGDIVFISSESVRLPFPYLGLYSATKAGLEGFSAAMRGELRDYGIRVSTLRAGGVQGGGLTLAWDPEIAAEFRATIERTGHAAFTGRHATKEAMADALLSVLTLDPDVNIDLVEVRAAALRDNEQVEVADE